LSRLCWRLTAAVVATALAAAAVAGFARAARDVQDEPITPIPTPNVDARKAALGELLFSDPRLSANGRISCRSCHDVQTNGATAQRFDLGADGRLFTLNTPTVFNAALSFRLNWEGNRRSLEELVLGTQHNPKPKGSGGPAAKARLQEDAADGGRFASSRSMAARRTRRGSSTPCPNTCAPWLRPVRGLIAG
jgi:cytochrome c peroxidase